MPFLFFSVVVFCPLCRSVKESDYITGSYQVFSYAAASSGGRDEPHHSSSSLGKSVRSNGNHLHKLGSQQSAMRYNSNNQKMAEALQSTRNLPSHNVFAASSMNESTGGGQAILQEMPINNLNQRSGEQGHPKVDRQNSFVVYNNGNNRRTTGSFGFKMVAHQN